MNVKTLQHTAAVMGLRLRAMVLVLALVSIGQLRAQPLDTLNARLRGLPIDSVEEREREATDPRTKFVTITRLTGE